MEVEYLKHFLKDVQKLKDTALKKELLDAITAFKKAKDLTELMNIKKLKGHSEAYRMRIGKYRLGFYYNGDFVELARFTKREDIYKLFP